MLSRLSIKSRFNSTYKLCNTKLPLKSSWSRKCYTNTTSDEKLSNNICRARSLLYDYAYNNNFYFYITLTLNKEHCDRFNLDKAIRTISEKIKWLRRKYKSKFDYLIIPELHEDGAYHFHGLFSEDFKFDMYVNDHKYLSINIFDNLGFQNVQFIDNYEAICKYILKYIGKGLTTFVKGQHLYYCSNGLKRSEKIGDFIVHGMDKFDWSYNGDFGSSKELDFNAFNEFLDDFNKYYYDDYIT